MAKSLHTPEYEHFRTLLIEAREQARLTQAEVAIKLSRPQSFVAKYEGGERRLDVIELLQVCAALGIDSHQIIFQIQARAKR